MLSEKRICEAEQNVRKYLAEGLLKKQACREEIFSILQGNSRESVHVADFLALNSKSDLWIIVTSYYSMYYMANAVLCRMGFKVGDRISHKVTVDSLIVFARKKLKDILIEQYEAAQDEALAGIKADALLEEFDRERIKRGIFQYETSEQDKHSKASTSLQRAKRFVFEMEKLAAEI